MLRKLTILFLLLALSGLDAAAQGAPPKPAQPPAPATPAVEPPPAMAVPPSYKFETRGRRDPFVNPVPKPLPPPPDPAKGPRPQGLKGVLLAEAQIVGVVVSAQAPDLTRTMIAALGGKTYFARKGDALFDAVIKEIRRDAVVFELKITERDGKITTQEVIRKVHPTP